MYYPHKIKEEPSTQYAVVDLIDKDGLPDVPAEAFNWPLKVKYDSYSELDVTDETDYVSTDDIPLEETDEEWSSKYGRQQPKLYRCAADWRLPWNNLVMVYDKLQMVMTQSENAFL